MAFPSSQMLKVLTETIAQLEARPDVDPADYEWLRQYTLRLLIEADGKTEKNPENLLADAA